MTKNSVTIVITSFRSEKRIINCLNSIDSKYKVIVVENSNNYKIKKNLENKYHNVSCILAGENLGYAKGNNLGLSKVKTSYALILNPDTIVHDRALDNFLQSAKKLKNFAIIGPAKQHEKNSINFHGKLKETDSVKGFAMFLNLSEFKNIGFFDDNFFIYLEEIDLCKRLKQNKKKIFLDPNIRIEHQGGISHDKEFNFEMELSRNWHWMWSLFYFNKKHNGFLRATLIILPKFLSSIIKYILFSLIFDKKKKLINLHRMSGIINSFLNKPSWYRPKV